MGRTNPLFGFAFFTLPYVLRIYDKESGSSFGSDLQTHMYSLEYKTATFQNLFPLILHFPTSKPKKWSDKKKKKMPKKWFTTLHSSSHTRAHNTTSSKTKKKNKPYNLASEKDAVYLKNFGHFLF